ncbi:flavin reductase family protein [Lentzea aerocolonigenes]|uniref:flavin reductase family protein n=1 Tax=Lentzea aerocolonigenes TaxID=68170 RepID=UPI0004C3D3E8|nr:flavin reductase family protein [Lentzea aerocolonigenes]MCP2242616.1 3-hydroxy-9,10-secoandrosta-1,3,5(10)-triene-9,17-dione monooxygenase reductase component [Lentzea aerocolonigenes]
MSARFRSTAATFPTGVTVLSTVSDGEPHGMTVNSFASISIDPLLVLVSVNSSSRTYERIVQSGSFAVTVLSDGQQEVARWFANSQRPSGADSFAGVSWKPAPHSRSPVLLDGISYFDCELDQAYTAGDHTMLIGAVRAYDVLSDRPPLLFVRSRFTELRK